MVMHIVANRYAVVEKIGSGGMGDVFRGIDQRTSTPVAIKALRSELANAEMVARFIREGEALRQLNHPNIVALLDAVQENGAHYLVMELVEGGALDEMLRRTPRLPLQQVLNIALDLADALTRAHRLNIIHRDIKPANVLIARDGMPRLTDFGIARVIGSDITETGTVMGTAAYIAPEVLEGNTADARSDIWSLGVMLYEILAGAHPFRTTNPGALIYSILNEPLPDLESQRPDVPPALIDLINRMVQKNPVERIPRMRLVGAELEALLAEELPGTGEELRRLTPSGSGTLSSRFATPSPAPASTLHNNLPVQTTPFVGRENELIELEKLIHDPSIRLLTILAAGGMGKTRLSLELAGKLLRHTRGDTLFESGIYFVDLAPLTSAENIVQTVAEAVSYAFVQDGREAKQQLLDYLHEKNTMLIMDNFEHVIGGRTLVQDILQAAPHTNILVTSREKLNLSAETVFILSGMEFPEWETPEDALEYGAVKLFMQSARRVRSDFQLEAGDLAYVARICRMVQGTPLGILLAAAWLDSLSPQEIALEISRSLDFLETEMHDLPERQRSLRAVFEYSWYLLTDEERTLFAQFSIFRGGFTREAAQQITGASLRTLTALINKSLLRRDNVSGRYDIHELLRQYAEEKLNASPELAATHDRHSQYYTGLVAQLAPRLKGHGQLEVLNVVETDFENVRTAWNWAVAQADAEGIRRAIEGVYLFLTFRNRFMDGEQLFRAARQTWRAEGEKPPLLAEQVLVRFAEKPPLADFRRGLTIAQQYDDAFEIAFCQRLLGHWLSHTEFNHEEGIPLLEQSLQGYEALGDKFYIAQVLDDLGWSHNLTQNNPKHRERVQHSLELRREIGDKIGVANSLRNMGGAVGGFYDPSDQAFNYWQEAKGIAYEMNDRLGIAWNASLQAATLALKAEFERAIVLLDEAHPHAADIGAPEVKGFIQLVRAVIMALRDEDYAQAKRLFDEGFPPGTKPDFRMIVAPFTLALVACGQHHFEVLQSFIAWMLKTPPFNALEFYVPMFMPCLIVKRVDEGQYRRAAASMRYFLEFTPSIFDLPYPTGWTRRWGLFTHLRETIESSLGKEAFDAAWESGASLKLGELADELRDFLDKQ
jgi:serine/threonine protein kinase/tetratricopeptide (TPR) repeat protein